MAGFEVTPEVCLGSRLLTCRRVGIGSIVFRGRISHIRDRQHETESTPMHGLDAGSFCSESVAQPWIKLFTKRRDRDAEIDIFDGGLSPAGIHEIVLADQAAPALDEGREDLQACGQGEIQRLTTE